MKHGKPFENLKPDNFKLLFFPYDVTIRSIRDLNFTHIPLLNNMKKTALKIINHYFSFLTNNDNKLKMEFHYTPSTYLLHLHVTVNDSVNHDNLVHICHSLESVIENITNGNNNNENYYKLNNIQIKVKKSYILERKKYIEEYLHP